MAVELSTETLTEEGGADGAVGETSMAGHLASLTNLPPVSLQ